MSKPEEKVDDPQQKETQKSEEAKKEEVKKEEVKKEPYKLPETKFFSGDKMEKFIEEEGLMAGVKPEEKPAEKPAEKPEEKKEPEKKEEEPPEKKEEKPAEETKKPFKVLTYKGKEHVIQTEEDFNKLASEGLHVTQSRQKDSEWERDLSEREKNFAEIAKPLETVAKAIEEGRLPLDKTPEKTDIDKILENEEIDPDTREALRIQNEKMKALEEKLNKAEAGEKEREEVNRKQTLEQAKTQLEGFVNESKEEFPFDEIKENETNITESMFVGMVVSKANNDRTKAQNDPAFQRRNIKEIIKETAQDLQKVQKFYETKYGTSDGKEPLTLAQIKERFPDQVKELEQDAVASHLEEQEKGAPIAKPAKEEATPETKKKDKKGFKNVTDAISQGLEDPEIAKGLKDFGDKALRETK